MPRRAVILLSGGLDSTTLLAHAVRNGFAAHCLSFRYGQRHGAELAAAADVARGYGAVEHRIAEIDLRAFGGSALTDDAIAVPKGRAEDEIATGIPVTYVPARNTIFLSFALGWAEVLGARDLFIGVNALDYSGYPDCRPAFIGAFEALANLATRAGVEGDRFTVHAPLIAMTKAEIIRHGLAMGVDYARTTSCYDPDAEGAACGACDACRLRARGFAEAGVPDPTRYAGTSRT
ncbi:MAG: 7-cyano-7-deazaguanine synthase QueC [Gemmatimonadota bacterium]|jgi:7-cyano-7-deazaguanine synthase|nr:7-cyano-7-deazaguanine synthase QueC [Gemmatimonadota bacterium]